MSNEPVDFDSIEYTDPSIRISLTRRQAGVEVEVKGQDPEQTAIAYYHVIGLIGDATGYAGANKGKGLTPEIKQAMAIRARVKAKMKRP